MKIWCLYQYIPYTIVMKDQQ